jgi:hypothetical protein
MRFTIRDVLWLTVVAALATCWYKERQSMADTVAKAASDLVAGRAADKAKLNQEVRRLAFMQKKTKEVADNASQMLQGINDAHQKEVARLNKKIYQLEGPGYGDKVEPAEVAGRGIEWWTDRADYFERKFREAEQNKAKAAQ